MKYGIISDIHANLEALRATLDTLSAERVDRIVCLGDIVGYNANPAECIDLIRECGALCVAGNHDRAVTGQIPTDGFPAGAARAVAWTRGQLDADRLDYLAALPLKRSIDGCLVAVHGALHPDVGCETVRLDSEERRRLSFEALAAHASGARICGYGHTHRLGIFELRDGIPQTPAPDEVPIREGSLYLVNPGTVGQPRTAERRATCLILDTTRQVLTARRVEYDAALTAAKTRKAGLGPRLSWLPPPVRSVLRRVRKALAR